MTTWILLKVLLFWLIPQGAESSPRDRNETRVHPGGQLLLPMASCVSSQRSIPQSLVTLAASGQKDVCQNGGVQNCRLAAFIPQAQHTQKQQKYLLRQSFCYSSQVTQV